MLNLIVRAQTLGWRLKNRLRNERGQTSSEYLVIAGLVVAIIIMIMGIFRKELTTAINNLSKNVVDSTK